MPPPPILISYLYKVFQIFIHFKKLKFSEMSTKPCVKRNRFDRFLIALHIIYKSPPLFFYLNLFKIFRKVA